MSNVLDHNIADHPAVAEHKCLMLLNYLVSSKAVRYFSSLKNRIAFGMLSVRSPSLRAEDQNFDRQTWLRKTPGLLPCLLPHGKYMRTVRWSLLGAKDSCRDDPQSTLQTSTYHLPFYSFLALHVRVSLETKTSMETVLRQINLATWSRKRLCSREWVLASTCVTKCPICRRTSCQTWSGMRSFGRIPQLVKPFYQMLLFTIVIFGSSSAWQAI